MEPGQKNRMLEILMGKIVRNPGLLVLWIFGEKAGFFKIFALLTLFLLFFGMFFAVFYQIFISVLLFCIETLFGLTEKLVR
jgi:hypothetical protein